MFEAVFPLTARWKSFGLALGLQSHILDIIESHHRMVDKCLLAVLQEWLRTVETPSWELLVSAVAHPVVGHQALAKEIAERYTGK